MNESSASPTELRLVAGVSISASTVPLGYRVAHQRTHDAADRAVCRWSFHRSKQALDFEEALAGREVDPGVAVLSCPWASPATDLTDLAVHPRSSDYPLDPTPAHDCAVLSE